MRAATVGLAAVLAGCGPGDDDDATENDDDVIDDDDASGDDDDLVPPDTSWVSLLVPRDRTEQADVRTAWLLGIGEGTTERSAVEVFNLLAHDIDDVVGSSGIQSGREIELVLVLSSASFGDLVELDSEVTLADSLVAVARFGAVTAEIGVEQTLQADWEDPSTRDRSRTPVPVDRWTSTFFDPDVVDHAPWRTGVRVAYVDTVSPTEPTEPVGYPAPAGEACFRVADPDGLSAGAEGQALVLLNEATAAGELWWDPLPDPLGEPESVWTQDGSSWRQAFTRVYVRDDVTLRGWYARTARPGWRYMNVDELPDLAGPDGVLGVADLGVFNVDEPCDPGAEVVLRAPAGELDFLLEGPALWSGAWREPSDVRDHWGTDEPRPPAVTVSIPLIE